MKLGSLKSESRDGELIVVSKDNKRGIRVPQIAQTMQGLMENWDELAPRLEEVYNDLNSTDIKSFEIHEEEMHSPLPRAYQWLDGSAYIQHIILVRKARNAEPPETLRDVPLMYQGLSDKFLAPREDIPYVDDSWGLDLEGEVGVILDKVPMGTKAADAHKYIKLIVIINDVSLRGLIPAELKNGFGFLQGKPASAHAPFAITPEELGEHWRDGRVHLPLHSEINGNFFGNPDAGDMWFSFYQLIEHAAKTRELGPGTILGSGTVANDDESKGQSCLAEIRMKEKIKTGVMSTPFLKEGDTVKIEMFDPEGNNLFGTIFQKVVKIP